MPKHLMEARTKLETAKMGVTKPFAEKAVGIGKDTEIKKRMRNVP